MGNGGFSLRSRKLMELTPQDDLKSLNLPTKSEDLIVCYYAHESLATMVSVLTHLSLQQNSISSPPEVQTNLAGAFGIPWKITFCSIPTGVVCIQKFP